MGGPDANVARVRIGRAAQNRYEAAHHERKSCALAVLPITLLVAILAFHRSHPESIQFGDRLGLTILN